MYPSFLNSSHPNTITSAIIPFPVRMSLLKKHILVNGIDTSYGVSEAVSGAKPWLFLHGWGQNMDSFRDIFARSEAQNIPYITLDLPGFGGTARPKETWGVGEYADFVKAFLVKTRISQPLAIGHSFGGRIIIRLASADSGIFSGIVLIGSAGIRPVLPRYRAMISDLLRPILAKPSMQSVRSFLRKQFGSRDYLNAGRMADIFRQVIGEDLQPLLSHIFTRTLLIWGEQDTETPLSDAQIMKREIPDAKLITFPEGTHFVFQEFSEEVFADILKWSDSFLSVR